MDVTAVLYDGGGKQDPWQCRERHSTPLPSKPDAGGLCHDSLLFADHLLEGILSPPSSAHQTNRRLKQVVPMTNLKAKLKPLLDPTHAVNLAAFNLNNQASQVHRLCKYRVSTKPLASWCPKRAVNLLKIL